MLLPKQNFEHWLVFRVFTDQDDIDYLRTSTDVKAAVFCIAGTQRLPTPGNPFTTIFIPYIDGFTTIQEKDIVFTIRNIKPNSHATATS